MRLEAVSNGLGSQSLYLVVLAAKGIIKSNVSITADTGAENDRAWSSGERTTARIYFDQVIAPYCLNHGIEPRFVRSLDSRGNELPSLLDHVRSAAPGPPNVPMFGSNGGRLRQVCTDKWKIRAVRQEARRMGATHFCTAQGIHIGESSRRVKGKFIGMDGQWSVYQDETIRDGVRKPIRWCTHYYPLVDLRLNRQNVRDELQKEGLPWLESSECDLCPHQDIERWNRHTQEELVQIAELESKFNGQYFFTDERIPLLESLKRKRDRPKSLDLDFGCENSYCGI